MKSLKLPIFGNNCEPCNIYCPFCLKENKQSLRHDGVSNIVNPHEECYPSSKTNWIKILAGITMTIGGIIILGTELIKRYDSNNTDKTINNLQIFD